MAEGVTAYKRLVEFEGSGEQIESALLQGSGASEHIEGGAVSLLSFPSILLSA